MSEKNEIQREFELERLVLFSDAVFAIAITLLIIEIKFPEIPKELGSAEIFHRFKPVIVQFFGFTISFIFVGVSWSRHLKFCHYLHKFDKGLIRLNLVLLFFIVCFPFSASGITEHIRPGFMVPVFIYLVNICCVMWAHYTLCNYVFYKKPHLSIPGCANEKNFITITARWVAWSFLVILIVYFTLLFIFPQDSVFPPFSLYLLPLSIFIMKRKYKKYKPAESVYF
ncbi:MAG: TMEM175 family protein [Ferruginibacter sp.]